MYRSSPFAGPEHLLQTGQATCGRGPWPTLAHTARPGPTCVWGPPSEPCTCSPPLLSCSGVVGAGGAAPASWNALVAEAVPTRSGAHPSFLARTLRESRRREEAGRGRISSALQTQHAINPSVNQMHALVPTRGWIEPLVHVAYATLCHRQEAQALGN